MTAYRRWMMVVFGASLLVCGCAPDTDALKAEIKEELKAELAADFDARFKKELEAAVDARVKAQLAGYRIGGASSPGPAASLGTSTPGTTTPTPAKTGEPAGFVKADPPPPKEPPKTAVTPPSTSKPAVGQDAQGLILKRVTATPEIVDREPSEVRSSFSLDEEKVVCFMEFRNKGGPERTISVVWSRNGKEFHRHSLPVRKDASRHRTYAKARISSGRAGQWTCGVENESGELLGSVNFTVGSAAEFP